MENSSLALLAFIEIFDLPTLILACDEMSLFKVGKPWPTFLLFYPTIMLGTDERASILLVIVYCLPVILAVLIKVLEPSKDMVCGISHGT